MARSEGLAWVHSEPDGNHEFALYTSALSRRSTATGDWCCYCFLLAGRKSDGFAVGERAVSLEEAKARLLEWGYASDIERAGILLYRAFDYPRDRTEREIGRGEPRRTLGSTLSRAQPSKSTGQSCCSSTGRNTATRASASTKHLHGRPHPLLRVIPVVRLFLGKGILHPSFADRDDAASQGFLNGRLGQGLARGIDWGGWHAGRYSGPPRFGPRPRQRASSER